MTKGRENRRTINILFVPGGAMLGLIPAIILSHLEDLTETPSSELFQVVDGVSTGSIIAASMNVRNRDDNNQPKFSSEETSAMFRSFGPEYFPPIPGRNVKMLTGMFADSVQDRTDPLKAENYLFRELDDALSALEKEIAPEQKSLFEDLKRLSTKRWLTKKTKKKAGRICDTIGSANENLSDLAGQVFELIFHRTHINALSYTFRQSVIGASALTKKLWAKDYLFDPKVPQDNLENIMGESRLSDCLTSTYISAYDIGNHKRQTFFCRKKDFFSTDADAEYVTSDDNLKLWDVVMASVANPFAFPPHVAENGSVYTDKAPIHTPTFSVTDVMKHKPEDADVKLTIISTGHRISKQKEENADLRDKYQITRNHPLEELSHYSMTGSISSIEHLIGKENITHLSPRLSARNQSEVHSAPSENILDASEENVKNIAAKAEQFICEEDQQMRDLAKSLVQNLYNIGNMDEEKYNRIMAKIEGAEAAPNKSCTKAPETFMQKAYRFFTGQPAKEQDNKRPAPKRNGTDGFNPPAP